MEAAPGELLLRVCPSLGTSQVLLGLDNLIGRKDGFDKHAEYLLRKGRHYHGGQAG